MKIVDFATIFLLLKIQIFLQLKLPLFLKVSLRTSKVCFAKEQLTANDVTLISLFKCF